MKPLIRLIRWMTCTHRNACEDLSFDNSIELRFCRACGRVLWLADDGRRRHNPHLLQDQLDLPIQWHLLRRQVRQWWSLRQSQRRYERRRRSA